MKVTLLGTGPSGGVPLIGCRCGVCRSDYPRNKRRRVSVLIEHGPRRLLVDTSPDLRMQMLDHDVDRVDAILYTHTHADHIHGIDDIRSFNFHTGRPVDIYGTAATLEELKSRFPYIFRSIAYHNLWANPSAAPHEIAAGKRFSIEDMEITPILQYHGKVTSLGFRVGNFAYSTDLNGLPEESLEALQRLDTWVVGCLQRQPAPTHAHLDMILEWKSLLQPRRLILTHMSHDMDYASLKKSLPAGVEPGFDNMVIDNLS